jgi:hypothetical protein
MRWRTFQRLLDEHEDYAGRSMWALADKFGLTERFKR